MTRSREEQRAWRRYLVAQFPGWLLVAVVVALASRLAGLPPSAAVLLLLVWIGGSALRFSRVERYYTSEPAPLRIVGELGVADTALTPAGMVRIHGELWQAVLVDRDARLDQGRGVRVRDVRGLELRVEPDDSRLAQAR